MKKLKMLALFTVKVGIAATVFDAIVNKVPVLRRVRETIMNL